MWETHEEVGAWVELGRAAAWVRMLQEAAGNRLRTAGAWEGHERGDGRLARCTRCTAAKAIKVAPALIQATADSQDISFAHVAPVPMGRGEHLSLLEHACVCRFSMQTPPTSMRASAASR